MLIAIVGVARPSPSAPVVRLLHLCSMNSSEFTWAKYLSRVGFAASDVWNAATNRPKPGFEEVGRCLAAQLVVRPRLDGEAVMLRHKESGDEFWLHALSDAMAGLGPVDAPRPLAHYGLGDHPGD